jgi:hypothetical protein
MTILDELFEQMMETAGRLSTFAGFLDLQDQLSKSGLSAVQKARVHEEMERRWDELVYKL